MANDLKNRNIEIIRDIADGSTYEQAASPYGITRERTRQIFYKFARKHKLMPNRKLATHTVIVLRPIVAKFLMENNM